MVLSSTFILFPQNGRNRHIAFCLDQLQSQLAFGVWLVRIGIKFQQELGQRNVDVVGGWLNGRLPPSYVASGGQRGGY